MGIDRRRSLTVSAVGNGLAPPYPSPQGEGIALAALEEVTGQGVFRQHEAPSPWGRVKGEASVLPN
jgi:hypothetical protein